MKSEILSFFKIPLFIFYFSKKRNEGGEENFGDILNLFIIKNLTSRPIMLINPSSFLFRKIIPHYFAIGSILYRTNKKSIVWGTGIMRKNEIVRAKKYFAVRGPRSRNRILELGHKCDKNYGDPALLTSLFYKPILLKKKIKYGIIPHYVDYKVAKKYFDKYQDVNVINILDPVKEVIDEVISCEKIFSSSLHGIIISHSYNIPALWLKMSNNLSGDNIKFYDYFESVELINNKPIELKRDIDLSKVFDENCKFSLPNLEVVKQVQLDLLRTCPFITKTNIKL